MHWRSGPVCLPGAQRDAGGRIRTPVTRPEVEDPAGSTGR